ncbi:MAG: hypothetical protein Ta2E_11080 [Mycoplasmoidaceae bacterium]|nr:MAG: hypothetical protein Ta2E_11080 [Mycoplasmoidaceae bacterium]
MKNLKLQDLHNGESELRHNIRTRMGMVDDLSAQLNSLRYFWRKYKEDINQSFKWRKDKREVTAPYPVQASAHYFYVLLLRDKHSSSHGIEEIFARITPWPGPNSGKELNPQAPLQPLD